MRYESLSVENFRGIRRLDISDLKKVNLLVGRNNCGKTTLLEAIFLLSGMSNPGLSLNIHNSRGLPSTSDSVGLIFRDLDYSSRVLLSGRIDNKQRQLEISARKQKFNIQTGASRVTDNIIGEQSGNYASTNTTGEINGIDLDFTPDGTERFHIELGFSSTDVKGTLAKNYEEQLKCTYLTPMTMLTQSEMPRRIEGLIVQKRLDSVVRVLQSIEPKVADIRMGAAGRIYIDIGAESLMPLNVMGDGMRRVLAVLAALNDTRGGVLLVDEIEAGLHYSSLEAAWKAILSACETYDVQLFATTHSYECIEALMKSCEALSPGNDDVRLVRLDRDGDIHRAFVSSKEVISVGIEKSFEVR